MSISASNRILVIGFGHTLRGDDALGQIVAGSSADRKSANVLAVSVTQLVPEMAALVASARAVIFIGAGVDPGQTEVEVRELRPTCPLAKRVHNTGPRELLALARYCFDRLPPAWLVTVPGHNCDIADGLPDAAHAQLVRVRQQVQQIIDQIAEDTVIHA